MWQAVAGCVSFLPAGSHVLLLCAHSTDSFFCRVCGQPAKHDYFFKEIVFSLFSCLPKLWPFGEAWTQTVYFRWWIWSQWDKGRQYCDQSGCVMSHNVTQCDSVTLCHIVSCDTMWHSGLLWLTHFDQWDLCSLLSGILAGTRVVTGHLCLEQPQPKFGAWETQMKAKAKLALQSWKSTFLFTGPYFKAI